MGPPREKNPSIAFPSLSGISEELRRNLQKHDIPGHFKPPNTLVHLGWDTSKVRFSVLHNAMRNIGIYISGKINNLFTSLSRTGHSGAPNFTGNGTLLWGQPRLCISQRRSQVWEEKASMPIWEKNIFGGGLRYFLSHTYNTVLHPWSKWSHPHTGSCDSCRQTGSPLKQNCRSTTLLMTLS